MVLLVNPPDGLAHPSSADGQPPTDGTAARQLDADVIHGNFDQDTDVDDLSIFAETSFETLDDVASARDGRHQRRTRNREAVIGALLELMREGSFEPSVAQIADRAGVSHRSVFRYFDDLSDLVRAAIDREVRGALPLAMLPNIGQGTLESRVDSFVESRLNVFGRTHQVGRVARLRSDTIPAIHEGLQQVVKLFRVQLHNHFGPELSSLDDTQAEFTIDAIQVLTGFEAYDLQLRTLEHSTERIRQVWTLALLALLRNHG